MLLVTMMRQDNFMYYRVHPLGVYLVLLDADVIYNWPENPGGALGQVSYGGVQLRGPNPYPILGKAGLRKHTLF